LPAGIEFQSPPFVFGNFAVNIDFSWQWIGPRIARLQSLQAKGTWLSGAKTNQ